MFHYWSQPKIVQQVLNFFIPKKETWSLKCKKTLFGDWVFDLPPFIKDEALTGGTNYVIDTFYLQIVGDPPDVGDTINITASIFEPKIFDAVLTDFKPDPSGFGTCCVEKNTEMNAWLCPMFQVMMPPTDKLYISFSAI